MAYKEYKVTYDPTFKRAADLSTVFYYINNNDGYFLACTLNDYLFTTIIIDSTEINHFITNYEPTSLLLPSADDAAAYAIINEGFFQQKYDMQPTVIYIGNAEPGALTSEAKWTIKRMSLDADGNITAINNTKRYSGVWNDRVTETYL